MGRTPRHLGGIAAGIAVLLVVPSSAFAGSAFIDGVTAGEVTSNSAIIWAQTKKPQSSKTGAIAARVQQLGSKRSFGILGLNSTGSTDKTVQTTVKHLKPGKTYRYQFCLDKGTKKPRCSDKGSFETAPKPSQSKTIHFAYSGDETGVAKAGRSKPFWGNFKAWKTIAGEHNDFNIDFGDTIYSDPEVPGAKTATTVKQKWGMYRKKLAIKNMRTAREATGMYNHWDDHEFIDNFSIPNDGRKLYDHSVKAFRNYEPVTYTKKAGIYRTERWGKNLELFFLDERSFRSGEATANGLCDNPTTPGTRDFAPTAPTAVRTAFGAVIPALKTPVTQACLDKINSPRRTMLGKSQLSAFLKAVKSSKAKWKVVMNEVPIQQYYADPYDRWEGYAYERVKLLNALQSANVSHLVFLTTDTHANFQNVIRYRTLANDSAPSNVPATAPPSDTPYQDFITGPVATRTYVLEIENTTGISGAGPLVETAFLEPQPPNGVGMSCYQGNQNSYAEVTVSKSKLKVDYKTEDGGPVVNPDTMKRCGPYVLTH